MNLAALLDLPDLESHLGRVDAALRNAVQAEDPYLAELAGHLLSAGGKRLRPALAVAAAAAGEADISDDVVQGGASVELVHLGSLYHDDVIDEAQVRRSVPTVNARWGNLAAILSGDFLLARASEIAARLGTEVAALLAGTIARLCEGQVGELQRVFDVGRSESEYLAAIQGKTASLIATSCRIGALTAGLGRADVDALTDYGVAFGMVFQIRDDILDLVATDAELGKPAGNDLAEGVYTLPVIRALASDDTGPALRQQLGRPVKGDENEAVRAVLRSSGAIAESLDVARSYADEAAKAVEGLPAASAIALGRLPHRLLDTVAV